MRKKLMMVVSVGLLIGAVGCASSQRVVKVGCGSCIYGMSGVSGCPLAVKVDGKPYLVSGVDMDDLGDAHAADGLCSIEREAKATGKVKGDRYVATKMELLPQK